MRRCSPIVQTFKKNGKDEHRIVQKFTRIKRRKWAVREKRAA